MEYIFVANYVVWLANDFVVSEIIKKKELAARQHAAMERAAHKRDVQIMSFNFYSEILTRGALPAAHQQWCWEWWWCTTVVHMTNNRQTIFLVD